MIIDALHLPELVFPITTVTVGYPAESPKQVDRLPIEGIIHEESYHDYTAEDINRYMLIRNLCLRISYL